ncbi:glycosyltransferase family 2 protein [Roseimicrobium sp. ORNL1]|uniref:glycosyltransferase family 2 protein n=1 Tax=Roseimicrobium sp. ORNL1 TaxID=2711231 RepID=UPI0013E1F4A6|nr:glycosyltransferase family 2 protein [Roseimicrobium sp. ORNL1]QIF05638.1 glycosyltransferase [Roseimicrobium sp. ORNL1]
MNVEWLDDVWFHRAVWITAGVILVLQVAQNSIYLVQLMKALPEFLRARSRASRLREWWLLTSEATPPMTLLVPAYNEEATIVESLRSTLTLRYPEYEIIVVNDGSKDKTLERLIEAFALHPVHRALPGRTAYQPVRGIYACAALPNLLVVDKQNGGKADALNAAIDLASHPYVCAVDADSLLDSDALLRAVRPFVDAPDTTLAVGGTIRVVNGCQVRAGQVLEVRPPKHWLELFQAVEYLRAFLLARMAWTRNQSVTIISGAFGIFRRDVLLELGGYAHGTVGEDMELVVRLHRWAGDNGVPSEVWHVPDPVCWTEVPDSIRVLSRQRTRWQRGLCETLWRHRGMLGRPRYGSAGMYALPSFLIFDVISPLLELLGLVMVPLCALAGILSWQFFVAYCAVVFGFGLCLSLGAMILSEFSLQHHRRVRDLLWMGIGAVVENFGYRQLNSWWRVMGIWQYLRGKQGWGAMTRKGFTKAPSS